VGANGTSNRILMDSFGTGTIGSIIFRKANGTAAVPSALLKDDQIGNIAVFGYGATAYTLNRAVIGFYADEDWTDNAQGSRINFNTSNRGTTSTGVERMRIDSLGQVGIGTQ